MGHSLRFGIITIQDLPWLTLVEHWKHIEVLGYDSVWVGDHYINGHNLEGNWLDGWTLLAALATQTSTIRIGTLVRSNHRQSSLAHDAWMVGRCQIRVDSKHRDS
jgi:alkanesulfonate monooxygenase SsuD/methylene tetrahydromethanopterin reductase-like flavin-dependent oxidoreductase (luciferase family)